jgi:NADPH2:quinone reductase
MTSTMRAVVLDAPGPPEALQIRELPIPEPQNGWVLIEVRAFGLNRSELQTRLGLAGGAVSYPRVLGIEAAGVVASCPGGEFAPGTQVVAMMGGMGRGYDGGYAEYTCVPASQVIPFESGLPWSTIGAVPETLQTAYGSLTVGLDARAGDTVLIRGGTSSVGMTLAVLAKQRGMTVFATTRDPSKSDALRAIGADEVIVDGGEIAPRVWELRPGGVDRTLELIGAPTLHDSMLATRVHGVVCNSGALSNDWALKDFYPTGDIPSGVFLTGYSGDASDLPAEVLQAFLDDVGAGRATMPIAKIYALEDIIEAHADMENNRVAGKLVVDLSE